MKIMALNIEEIVKKGDITIYKDTDRELVKEVHKYNANVTSLRIKKAYVKDILQGYYITNLIFNAFMIYKSIHAPSDLIVRNPLLALIAYVICIIGFLNFAVSKKNLLISSLFIVLLCIFEMRFAVLFVFDIILYIFYKKGNEGLEKEMGYPAFLEIYIKYDNSFENKKDN